MSGVVDIHKKKGIRPLYDVYIGRRINRPFIEEFQKDSKWANHFYTDLESYERHVRFYLWEELEELRGKKLGCWCITTKELTPVKCHGQILMKLLREKKEIPIPICPHCKVKCKVGKPFLVITQITRRFDCPKCEHGGIQKMRSIK